MESPIGLKFQFWPRGQTGWVRNFSGPLARPRGHKLKEQIKKIADFQKVIHKVYLKHLSPNPWA